MFRTLSLPLLAILVLVFNFHRVFSMPLTLNATSEQPAQRLPNNVRVQGLYLMIKRTDSQSTKHSYSHYAPDEEWAFYVGNTHAFQSMVKDKRLIPKELDKPPRYNTPNNNSPTYLEVYVNFENREAMASAFEMMCSMIRGFDTNLQFIDRAIGLLVKELKVVYERDSRTNVEKQVTELPKKWIAMYDAMKPIGPAGAKVPEDTSSNEVVEKAF
ncbi:uncharacterized protein C8R40DRAFT_1238424 [Lentinula edodes]|uniref:uncharacterized protein n=1 Tax=Lentinula edodes TaxID=5353 RepID=UPI001E8D93CA|nr:uncharacterized protein C8R40DRAFT_1238424 [Lentinula edodes]KAH7873677.1 hypothetical protein C8R40DRAFT_1238424 [Lentinula edodes]